MVAKKASARIFLNMQALHQKQRPRIGASRLITDFPKKFLIRRAASPSMQSTPFRLICLLAFNFLIF
jgi:hypothetical protein